MGCALYQEGSRFLKRRRMIDGRLRSVRESVPLPYCEHAHSPVVRAAAHHDPNGPDLLGCGGDARRCQVDEALRTADDRWAPNAFADEAVEPAVPELAEADRHAAARVLARALGKFSTVSVVTLHGADVLTVDVSDSRELAALGPACKAALDAFEDLAGVVVHSSAFTVVLRDVGSGGRLGRLAEWVDVVPGGEDVDLAGEPEVLHDARA